MLVLLGVGIDDLAEAEIVERVEHDLVCMLVALREDKRIDLRQVLGRTRVLKVEKLREPVDALLLDDLEALRDKFQRRVFSFEFRSQVDEGGHALELLEEGLRLGVLSQPLPDGLHAVLRPVEAFVGTLVVQAELIGV